MARIRTIKPDAFRSDTLSLVPRGTRWTFAGLWTYCDDAGRGRADARLIWADLYPLDPDVSVEDVEQDLKLLESVGAIAIYEVEGRLYLHIPAWNDHQAASYRRTESKLPPPPENAVVPVIPDSSRKDVQTADKSVLEVEGKGKGSGREQGSGRPRADARNTDPELPPIFLEFCAEWPGTVKTKPALAAWTAAVKRTNGDPQRIIRGAIAYAQWFQLQGLEPRYMRDAVKWLADDGWRDELKTPNRASPKSTTDERVTDAFQLAQQLRAEENGPAPKAIGR